MDWFGGSIVEAIGKAKSNNAVFMVAIHGAPTEDGNSDPFLSLLDSSLAPKLSSALPNCVALKLQADSVSASQFSALYPVVLVPSLYFIDSRSGVDVEVTGGPNVTEEKLEQCLQKVADAMKGEPAPRVGSQQQQTPQAQQQQQAEPVASTSSGAAASSAVSPSLEERVEKAKRLVAEKQALKRMEEEEKEKNSEVSRRELGRQMQENKRKQEDAALREAAEERRRDREEAKQAKERVKKQIEQDRLERAAKFNKVKEEEQAKRDEKERQRLQEEGRAAEEALQQRSTKARIQFRLPDGRSKTKVFDADAPLSALFAHVRDEMDIPFRTFTLSTTFPTKVLDTEDQASTLKTHALTPSATVLVLPKSDGRGGSTGDGTGLMSIIFLVLTPFQALWALLQSLLGLNPPRPAVGQSPPEAQQGTEGGSRDAARQRRDPGVPAESTVKRSGNVARLRNADDDDDDNNTWNGNSTQQQQ